MRLAKKLDGWSRAAIGRRLGEAVVGGKDLTSAVVGVFEELQTAPGTVIPIGKLENVNRKEVSIEGRVEVLWDADSPAIAQVGLIADDSGKTKVTSWVASDQPLDRRGRARADSRSGEELVQWARLRGSNRVEHRSLPRARSVVGSVASVRGLFLLRAGPTQTPPPHPPLRARFAARSHDLIHRSNIHPTKGEWGRDPFLSGPRGCGRTSAPGSTNDG